MDISDEKRIQLAKKFRDELVRKEASTRGVSADDLMRRVVDGQATFVKKAEYFKEQKKQQELSGQTKVIRTLRDGEDSLVSRIEKEILLTRELAEELTALKIITGLERVDHLNSIAQLQSRNNSQKINIIEIEAQIERVKARDPIFAEAEKALSAAHYAKSIGEDEKAEQIIAKNRDVLAKYHHRRRSLNTLIQAAQHGRFDMQREYWRILNYKWRLLELASLNGHKQLQEICADLQPGSDLDQFKKNFADYFTRYKAAHERHKNISNRIPPQNSDPAVGTKIWDEVLSSTVISVDTAINLIKQLESMIEQYDQNRKDNQDQRFHLKSLSS